METQSGLPVRVAAFVGRERERAKVAALITEARVATLTGSGGSDKTRLAVGVAGDVASRFSAGASQAPTDTLAERLQARNLLIVVDNCEHLVEARAELVGALSSACPQLHVLATSRVPPRYALGSSTRPRNRIVPVTVSRPGTGTAGRCVARPARSACRLSG
jgi:predicted ATPase